MSYSIFTKEEIIEKKETQMQNTVLSEKWIGTEQRGQGDGTRKDV
jgi:hypothetical protein